MNTITAVLTGKSSAAISSIAVYGQNCVQACREITRDSFELAKGSCKLCRVGDESGVVDEVLIAREQDDCCVISSHGNPLIVDMITSLLASFGAKVVTAEELTSAMLSTRHRSDSLAVEIKLTQNKAFSLKAVRLLQNQKKAGLGLFIERSLQARELNIEQIHEKCREILTDSIIFGRLLRRIRVVIAGLPNSGKSLLFNRLCGRQAAIVADHHGTTRDWLVARCKLGPLSTELIDTAGLDKTLEGTGEIDSLSRKAAAKLIEDADVVLHIVDVNLAEDEKVHGVDELINQTSKGIVIKVYNKADTLKLRDGFADGCLISAQNETGIKELVQKIIASCGTGSLEDDTAICFTHRQRSLIEQILKTKDEMEIKTALRQIKGGDV